MRARLTLLMCLWACTEPVVPAPPELQLQPAGLSFADLAPGASATRTVRLRNPGESALAIGDVSLQGDARGAFSFQGAVTSLPAAGEATLEVSYRAPLAEGSDTAALVFRLESGARRLPLSGRSCTVCLPPDGGGGGPADGGNATCPAPGTFPTVALGPAEPWWRHTVAPGRLDVGYRAVDAGYEVFTERVLDDGGTVAAARFGTNGVEPAVAQGDGGYLVAYVLVRTSPLQRELRVQALTADGIRVGPDLGVAAPGTEQAASASVAWNPLDGEYAVLWTADLTAGGGSRAFFARVGPQGQLGPATQLSRDQGSAGGQLGSTALVFGTGRWAAAYGEGSAPMLATLDRSGAVLSRTAQPFATSSVFAGPQLATSGADYGLVTVERPSTPPSALRFSRAAISGAPIAGSSVRLPSTGSLISEPGVAWTGAQWLLVWREHVAPSSYELWSARVSASGALVPGSWRRITCGPQDAYPSLVGTLLSYTLFGAGSPMSQRMLLTLP